MKLTYIGEPDMVYPTLGLEPVQGQEYELDEAPLDGRWATVGTDPKPITPPADKPDPAEPAQTAGNTPPPAQEPPGQAETPAQAAPPAREPAAQPAAPSTAPAAADQPVTTTDAATTGA